MSQALKDGWEFIRQEIEGEILPKKNLQVIIITGDIIYVLFPNTSCSCLFSSFQRPHETGSLRLSFFI